MNSPSSADSARGRRLGAMGSCLFFLLSCWGDMKSWNPGARFVNGDAGTSSVDLVLESDLSLFRVDSFFSTWCFLTKSMFLLWRSELSFLNDSQRSSRRSTVRGRRGRISNGWNIHVHLYAEWKRSYIGHLWINANYTVRNIKARDSGPKWAFCIQNNPSTKATSVSKSNNLGRVRYVYSISGEFLPIDVTYNACTWSIITNVMSSLCSFWLLNFNSKFLLSCERRESLSLSSLASSSLTSSRRIVFWGGRRGDSC